MGVSVSINQSGPYEFMVDTGSQITIIEPSLAADLRLQSLGKMGVVSDVRRAEVEMARLDLIETGHYALASLGVLYSVFGLYYYLKIANAMFMGKAEKGEEKLAVSLSMRVAIALAGIATLYIGLLPNSSIELVNWALGIAQNPSVAKLGH